MKKDDKRRKRLASYHGTPYAHRTEMSVNVFRAFIPCIDVLDDSRILLLLEEKRKFNNIDER